MDNRAWILCTKWSGDKAKFLVNKAASTLYDFGFDIKLNEMLRSGSGTEQLMPDSSLHYEVGIKEIYENPRKLFSIHEALAPTVTCFHEVCGHGGQWRHEALKDEPLSRVLLINDLACKCSNQFYGVDNDYKNPKSHYFEHPYEIAAQYMALKITQAYVLSGIWINQHDYGPQIRQLPVFKNIEFPNNIKELIRDTPDPPDEDELDLNALIEDDIDFARAVEQIDVDVGQSL